MLTSALITSTLANKLKSNSRHAAREAFRAKVLTHTFITQWIWVRGWDNDVASLRVFMVNLRKKLESAPDSPQYIQTHIGIGYRMLKVE